MTRRIVAGAVLAAVMFAQGCLRYEVIRPPKVNKQLVSLQAIDFKKKLPIADKLPLPQSLQKKRKPELRFITLDNEYKPGDLLWLNSKEQ